MAAAKKKTSSKSRKSSEQARRSSEALARTRRRRNIWAVVLFALGLFFVAFSVTGNAQAENPTAWDEIHKFFCGVFGMAVYFVGPIIIYIALLIASDKGKSTIFARLIQLCIIILMFTAAIQIFFVGSAGEEGAELGEKISAVYEEGVAHSGGGVVGLVLGLPLLMFGRLGASIVIILLVFVMVMIIANINLIDLIRLIVKPVKKGIDYSKEVHEQHKEDRAYVKQERERLAEEQRALREQQRLQAEKEQPVPKPKSKGAGIMSVISGGQQEVTEQDVEESIRLDKEKPVVDPVAEQQKENRNFQRELKDYIADMKPNVMPAHLPEGDDDKPYCPDFDNTENTEGIESTVSAEAYIEENGVAEIAEEQDNSGAAAVMDAINEFEQEESERLKQQEENLATVEEAIAQPAEEIAPEPKPQNPEEHAQYIIAKAEQYTLPPVDLLNDIVVERSDADIKAEIDHNAQVLVDTLKSFGVQTRFLEAARGPSVTRYELQPAPGVKISKITGLIDDIALNLATAGVRIEAPIPNKAAVGIEVPNKQIESVPIRSMLDSEAFRDTKSKLGAALGKSISGEIVIADIAKMPHVLIAGTTGSGKSVCVNSIIMSILFRSTPDEVRFLMIDPKAVEFMIYNGIPHLLIPVVTDPKKAAGALSWAVTEMLERYKKFSANNVRDINGYNSLAKGNEEIEPMPQIVIFIDELADLMMASPGEVEDSICRLAQMARAAGMHLVIATQRPSVNVVTGVIKANIPSRIALKVASQVDSRTIIDSAGAEKLLGKGDMLYFPVGMPKPLRVQGCWVSDKEVERVVEFIKNSFTLSYNEDVIKAVEENAERAASNEGGGEKQSGGDIDAGDDKLDEAIEAVIEAGQASTSYLQRKLKLGYGRAARLIDIMEEMGVVGPFEVSKPRQVIMTKQEWYERKLNKKEE